MANETAFNRSGSPNNRLAQSAILAEGMNRSLDRAICIIDPTLRKQRLVEHIASIGKEEGILDCHRRFMYQGAAMAIVTCIPDADLREASAKEWKKAVQSDQGLSPRDREDLLVAYDPISLFMKRHI
jgi:hypothetical protein